MVSMEQDADTAEAAVVDHYFLSSTENIFVPVCLRTSGRLFCDAPSVFSRGHNTSTVVTATRSQMHTNFDTKNTHYETVNKKKDKWIFKRGYIS